MRSLGKKPHFGAFPEAKKGVVNCASLRKAAHWPNNNANHFGAFPEAKKGVVNCARLRTGPLIMQIPRGYQKKGLLCRKSAILSIRWKKPF